MADTFSAAWPLLSITLLSGLLWWNKESVGRILMTGVCKPYDAEFFFRRETGECCSLESAGDRGYREHFPMGTLLKSFLQSRRNVRGTESSEFQLQWRCGSYLTSDVSSSDVSAVEWVSPLNLDRNLNLTCYYIFSVSTYRIFLIHNDLTGIGKIPYTLYKNLTRAKAPISDRCLLLFSKGAVYVAVLFCFQTYVGVDLLR